MAKKKKTNNGLEVNEIQELMTNIYKEGLLDGFLMAQQKLNSSMKERKEIWKDISDKGYELFSRKFIERKGGKNKHGRI